MGCFLPGGYDRRGGSDDACMETESPIPAGMAMRYGVSSGVFFKRSGTRGGAESVRLAADTSDAVQQGYISMTGVFIDTIVICSLTGLAIAASGMLGQRDAQGRSPERYSAHDRCFFRHIWQGRGMDAHNLHLHCLRLLRLSPGNIREKAFEYLTGSSRPNPVVSPGLWTGHFLGAVCSLEAVWDFSDICNGLMAVPNLLAVLTLSRGICREIRKL
ncbi:MAG: alanine:cation symporter family protein [Waltera sp.]